MIRKILTVFVILLMTFCLVNNSVFAECGNPQTAGDDCNNNGILDRCEDPKHKYFVGVCNPLGGGDEGSSLGTVGSKVPSNIKSAIKEVWGTFTVLAQIASVACVVFAGVRYMWSGADKKADIKKGLMYLVIGAVLVFCTVTLIDFVIDVYNTSIISEM